MNAALPKQFLLIDNKPLLMHTLQALHEAEPEANIVLVLPESHFQTWDKLCIDYSFNLKHRKVAGGQTRFESVKNGLSTITSGLIAVHDGVRPLVSATTVARCFEAASNFGAAVPVVWRDWPWPWSSAMAVCWPMGAAIRWPISAMAYLIVCSCCQGFSSVAPIPGIQRGQGAYPTTSAC